MHWGLGFRGLGGLGGLGGLRGFRIQGSGFRVQGLGVRVQGSGILAETCSIFLWGLLRALYIFSSFLMEGVESTRLHTSSIFRYNYISFGRSLARLEDSFTRRVNGPLCL